MELLSEFKAMMMDLMIAMPVMMDLAKLDNTQQMPTPEEMAQMPTPEKMAETKNPEAPQKFMDKCVESNVFESKCGPLDAKALVQNRRVIEKMRGLIVETLGLAHAAALAAGMDQEAKDRGAKDFEAKEKAAKDLAKDLEKDLEKDLKDLKDLQCIIKEAGNDIFGGLLQIGATVDAPAEVAASTPSLETTRAESQHGAKASLAAKPRTASFGELHAGILADGSIARSAPARPRQQEATRHVAEPA